MVYYSASKKYIMENNYSESEEYTLDSPTRSM